MILFELIGNERHPAYQSLAISNGARQYDFLNSVVLAALDLGKPLLSQTLIKALNYHAISCLHVSAGEFRPCGVTVGNYQPPEFYRVQALMDDFVNDVNRHWVDIDAVVLSAFVLWKLNHIHPFINGNGRTARAACYFVLCMKAGGLIPGSPILPELITQNRDEYVAALREVDKSILGGPLDLTALHTFVSRLVEQQIASAGTNGTAES